MESTDGDGERGGALGRQAMIVTGFLGGASFTALLIVLQSPTSFDRVVWPLAPGEYLAILVTLLSVVCCAFVFSSLEMMRIAAGEVTESSEQSHFATVLLLIGVLGLLLDLPLLLFPFTAYGALIVAGVEAILIILDLGLDSSKREKSNSLT